MRAFVFTDKALTKRAGQFVWLEVNTELAKNAPIRKKYPIEALPTFFVVDPKDESVALRLVGSANVAQMDAWLGEGLAKVSGVVAVEGPDAALALADRYYGEGKNAEAGAAYLNALKQATPDWSNYARTVESALFALSSSDSNETAARLAHAALPKLNGTPSGANVAASGLGAAIALPPEHAERAAWIAEFEAATRAMVKDPALALAGDDRSGMYIALLDARNDAKDSTGARAVTREWADFLDGEAAKAKTPDKRAVYDPHRLSAYLELGEPEKALPFLEQSERDFPDDYNPPARQAIAYRAMKEWKKGLAASDRAMARAYGPRKLGFYQTRADLFVGLGDKASARKTLEEAIAMAESLPPGQRSENTIKALKKKLAGITD